MFSISEEQLGEFSSKQAESYLNQLCAHCTERFPVVTGRISADALHEAVVQAVKNAQELRFQSSGGIRLIVELSLMFGHGFAADPLHGWATKALDVPDHAGEPRRARKLYEASNTYISDLLGNSMRSPIELTQALRAFLAQDDFDIAPEAWATEVEQLIADRFPEHIQTAMPGACHALVAGVETRAAELGLKRPADAAHCVALQIAFGHQWFDDQALPFLRRALDEGGMKAARKAALDHLPRGAS